MRNTEGRPLAPRELKYGPSEALVAWAERDEISPASLRRITPWHFYHLLWCSQDDDALEDFLNCGEHYPGLRAAAYGSKNYLLTHIDRDGLFWRYLSRSALTIWISANWTTDDLTVALIGIKRSR